MSKTGAMLQLDLDDRLQSIIFSFDEYGFLDGDVYYVDSYIKTNEIQFVEYEITDRNEMVEVDDLTEIMSFNGVSLQQLFEDDELESFLNLLYDRLFISTSATLH